LGDWLCQLGFQPRPDLGFAQDPPKGLRPSGHPVTMLRIVALNHLNRSVFIWDKCSYCVHAK
ncbi:MAG: hypothetical protein R3Y56_09635, partial [Akkermansia sp.]